jgi:hypothetical protein
VPAGTTVKAIRTGKLDEEPGVRHITLRGVEYTITEIDVPGYDKALEASMDENGQYPFNKLLRHLVMACVRPLPKTPWKFPVYRTLEGIINDMHYTDLPDEAKKTDETDETEGDPAPNA